MDDANVKRNVVKYSLVKTDGKELVGHTNEVICLDVSPNTKFLASGSYDRTIRIWKNDKDESKCHKIIQPKKVFFAATQPDGTIESKETELDAHISTLTFVSDSMLLVSIDSLLIAYSIDVETELIEKEEGFIQLDQIEDINCVKFQNGIVLIAGDAGITEIPLNSILQTTVPKLLIGKHHTAFVNSVDYYSSSKSGLGIVSGGFDCKVILEDEKRKANFVFDLNQHDPASPPPQMLNPPYVQSVAVYQKTGWAAAASGNGTIEFFHLASGTRLPCLKVHRASCFLVTFPKFCDEPSLISVGDGGAVIMITLQFPAVAEVQKYGDVTTRRADLVNKILKNGGKATKPQVKLLDSFTDTLSKLNAQVKFQVQWGFKHSEKINWISTDANGNLFIADLDKTITCHKIHTQTNE